MPPFRLSPPNDLKHCSPTAGGRVGGYQGNKLFLGISNIAHLLCSPSVSIPTPFTAPPDIV